MRFQLDGAFSHFQRKDRNDDHNILGNEYNWWIGGGGGPAVRTARLSDLTSMNF